MVRRATRTSLRTLPIGQILRMWRESRDWTLEELAERCGTTKPTVSRWENARRGIKVGVLYELADIYEVPVARLHAPPPPAGDPLEVNAARITNPKARAALNDLAESILRDWPDAEDYEPS